MKGASYYRTTHHVVKRAEPAKRLEPRRHLTVPPPLPYDATVPTECSLGTILREDAVNPRALIRIAVPLFALVATGASAGAADNAAVPPAPPPERGSDMVA